VSGDDGIVRWTHSRPKPQSITMAKTGRNNVISSSFMGRNDSVRSVRIFINGSSCLFIVYISVVVRAKSPKTLIENG